MSNPAPPSEPLRVGTTGGPECQPLVTRHCRSLATHEPHEYQRRGWVPTAILSVEVGGFSWVPKGPFYT